VTRPVDEPSPTLSDAKELLLAFLDHYRSVIARKLDGLSEADLRTSRLPSGWSPLELLKHLVFMERRWLVWGFAAEQLPEPWGDDDHAGRWRVGPGETATDLLAAMRAGGARTRAIAVRAALEDISAAGGRFTEAEPRPTLGWILVHVLQEYARHAGHLDIVREIADGAVGE
jgi:Protein of unknown function (DUF664)